MRKVQCVMEMQNNGERSTRAHVPYAMCGKCSGGKLCIADVERNFLDGACDVDNDLCNCMLCRY